MEGARSALVRRASDQLKPSPSCRQDRLDLSFWGMLLFVLAAADAVGLCAEEEVLADDAVRCFAAMDDPREEYLPFPVVPPPRTSRNACAPNDTRRAKGETGVVPGGVFSLSSITASSR